ncbi:hypothetical protein D3875_17005 [Deinococcus cavernae]|uniref:Uncharacterized protein n=1 Tax=Deinococcus cavernae TaxID=2320857 RepID=A0A418VCV6_9DEIO|nr:hypothetical protein D3875_17005 [Deinococcus cavernae]
MLRPAHPNSLAPLGQKALRSFVKCSRLPPDARHPCAGHRHPLPDPRPGVGRRDAGDQP